MALSEADTRAKLIDPAIHACGWSEDMICRETTLGAVEIIAGKARQRSGGRTDYTLRVRVSTEAQPVAVALLEAKKDTLPPGHGLDLKGYLAASRHNVQFVFSSNGYLFVEFDRATGMTSAPRPLSEFPSPGAFGDPAPDPGVGVAPALGVLLNSATYRRSPCVPMPTRRWASPMYRLAKRAQNRDPCDVICQEGLCPRIGPQDAAITSNLFCSICELYFDPNG